MMLGFYIACLKCNQGIPTREIIICKACRLTLCEACAQGHICAPAQGPKPKDG